MDVTGRCGKIAFRLIDEREHLARSTIEDCAGCCRLPASPDTFEERHSDEAVQRRNLCRDRRLRDVERPLYDRDVRFADGTSARK